MITINKRVVNIRISGARGMSNYQIYASTTSDDPVLTEEQWLASLGGGSELIVSDTPPPNPTEGMQWYDSEDGVVSVWDGTVWVSTAAPGFPADSIVTSMLIDDGTDVYADGDTAGTKMWTVLSGTGTSAGSGTEHTLVASTGGANTVFVRDVSLDARFSAFEFEIEKDANLSELKFGIVFGDQSALKSFNLVAWGVSTYLYTGKYIKVVATIAEMNSGRTAGWTQDMLKNCKQISITAKPTAGNSTAIKLRKLSQIQSDGVGRVCFQFDDNNLTTHTTAEPILTANGYAGDIAVEYETVGSAGRGTLANLQARYAQGWGMLGHGSTQFTSLTESQQITAHKAIKDVLLSNGFTRGADHFVWPGGASTIATDDIAARFWKTRRRVARMPELVMPGTYEPAQPNHIYLQTGFTTATVKGLMDEAKAHGATVVLTLHGVLDTPVAAEDISTAKFTEIVEYAASIGLIDARYHEIFTESP